jgi:CheY-like chemotaxis protein
MARIREHPELADAQVIGHLPAGDPELAARCRELGLSHFLTKPAKASELLGAIEAAMPSASRDDEAPAERAGAAAPQVRPLSILLAEDGLINQEVAVGLLELRGHQVTTADNGRLAIAALEKQSFDVVLMDLEMPEMDGLAATAAIRLAEQDTNRRIPIIAMTAHAIKGFREQCLAAGMDGYVSKPIQPAELFAAVENAVASSASPTVAT